MTRERQQDLAGKIIAEIWAAIKEYENGGYFDYDAAEEALENIEDICLKYMEGNNES